MFRKINDFVEAWKMNAEGTLKVLEAVTDESLKQPVADGHRSLGRAAWAGGSI